MIYFCHSPKKEYWMSTVLAKIVYAALHVLLNLHRLNILNIDQIKRKIRKALLALYAISPYFLKRKYLNKSLVLTSYFDIVVFNVCSIF